MGEYSKSAIIKYTRKSLGMTQEELSEGICDPVTLSRYESGQLDPSDDKFTALMQKMGESGDVYLFPVECESADLEKPMANLTDAMEQRDWKLAKHLIHKIESEYDFPLQYPENKQYMLRMKTILKYETQQIDAEETLQEFEKAFSLTFKSCKPEQFPLNRVLRETEILVLYDIALFNDRTGNLQEAYQIYKRLCVYLQNKTNVFAPYSLIYLGFSNFLGLNGRFNESLEICFFVVRKLYYKHQLKRFYNFYYNIGWLLMKMIENDLESKQHLAEAKCYIWISYQFCLRYPENKDNAKIIEKLL